MDDIFHHRGDSFPIFARLMMHDAFASRFCALLCARRKAKVRKTLGFRESRSRLSARHRHSHTGIDGLDCGPPPPLILTGVCRLQEAVGKSRQSRQSNSKNISKKKKVARLPGLLSIFEVVREMDCLNHFWVREVHAKVPARAATKIGGGVPPQPVSDHV